MITLKQLSGVKNPYKCIIILPNKEYKYFRETKKMSYKEARLVDYNDPNQAIDAGLITPELKVPAVWFNDFLVIEDPKGVIDEV